MIYKALYSHFSPEELLVMAFYTRRGGIDINPVRANRKELIDRFCPHIVHFERNCRKIASPINFPFRTERMPSCQIIVMLCSGKASYAKT